MPGCARPTAERLVLVLRLKNAFLQFSAPRMFRTVPSDRNNLHRLTRALCLGPVPEGAQRLGTDRAAVEVPLAGSVLGRALHHTYLRCILASVLAFLFELFTSPRVHSRSVDIRH